MPALCLLALCLLVPAAASAQSFRDALISAYNTNPDLLGARATLRATDEQLGIARAGWLPTIGMTSSAGQQNDKIYHPGLSDRINSAAVGLQLQQPLFTGGRTPASVTQAENSIKAGRADLLGAEQTALLRAARAYQDVLRDRVLLALAREKEKVIRQEWQEISVRFRAGQLTRPDVDQANSRYLRARADTVSQIGQTDVSIANFRAAVGLPPVNLTPPPPLPGLPQSPDTAATLADANSPVVIASAFRERAALAQIGVARADLLPTIGATVTGGRDYGQTFPHFRAQTWGATVDLNIPLYQGGAAFGRLHVAQENAEKSRLDTLVSRRDAVQNAISAFSSWTSSAEAARIAAQQVGIAQAAYEGVRRQAALGARSTFELLGQLQEVFDARSSRTSLEHDAAVASYQLLVAVGRFTVEDLRLGTEAYDPAAHYRAARSRGGLP